MNDLIHFFIQLIIIETANIKETPERLFYTNILYTVFE